MKTPEEIKAQALDESGCCGGCELYNTTVDNPFGCQEAQVKTALVAELVAYTERIESENADLKSRLAQAERERDAVIADLSDEADCNYCKHEPIFHTCPETGCHACERDCPCARCSARQNNGFEWRGVCPENTKEDSDA